jgi:hypothetical protein
VKKKKSNPVKTQRKPKHPANTDANAGIAERKTDPDSLGGNVPSGKWLFRCKLSERGTCEIKPWLMKQSVTAHANLDRTIQQLADQPRQNWCKPAPASTIGDSIFVIRFKKENRKQLRIFGHFSGKGTGEDSVVMTLDGYEKDDKYYPPSYAETARIRRDWCNDAHNTRTILCRYAKSACDDGAVQPPEEFHTECTTCKC